MEITLYEQQKIHIDEIPESAKNIGWNFGDEFASPFKVMNAIDRSKFRVMTKSELLNDFHWMTRNIRVYDRTSNEIHNATIYCEIPKEPTYLILLNEPFYYDSKIYKSLL